MTVTHGADLGALREWSTASADGASRLEEIANRLDRSLTVFAWNGPDHLRFSEQWQTHFTPVLRSVSDGLAHVSDQVAREADQQQQASDTAREAREAGWARGAGRLLLGVLGNAGGGPVGSVIGALAGPRLVDRMVGVADARADRTGVTEITATAGITDTLPTSPGDMVHDMADMYDHEGAVRVDIVTRPDGSQVALLYVPGTQDWSLDPDGGNPMGAYGAVGAASGKDTPIRRVVLEAMEQVPEGVPIHLATHSQSSFAALDLAADPYVRARHDIASIVTTGAGGGNFDVPAGTTLVSVRNPFDPVARIGGAPDGAIDVTGSWGTSGHPHSSREYANLLDRSSSPELNAWWRSVGIDPGSTMETRVFQGTVEPKD
ncbi:WXG100 family type VII secretion target [Pseudactinotalea sp.]|uniref:WXG100 family type VII secretion target n=1 Tax=Pseudactinotalea sp. TaxID=1926260 RepID=UPI003B3ABD6F